MYIGMFIRSEICKVLRVNLTSRYAQQAYEDIKILNIIILSLIY